MDRRERILEHIRPGMRGIEIGPYFAPLVPKAEGWDVLTLDVFPAEALRESAARDPAIPDEMIPRIETVDLLGPAHRMAELAEAAGHAPGSIDFIVSSHNFEHLPDPVRFLQAAERMLKPGGVISMAVPDKRRCFDMLRPRSTLGAVLEAYFERREKPAPRQNFEQLADMVTLLPNGAVATPAEPLAGSVITERLEEEFAAWKARLEDPAFPYADAHCWTFTPASAELLLRDLRFLGLTGLEVMACGPSVGIEFVLHLQRPPTPREVERDAHYATRRRLHAAMMAEDGPEMVPDGAQKALDAVLASNSWKLTAPLRAVAGLAKGRRSA